MATDPPSIGSTRQREPDRRASEGQGGGERADDEPAAAAPSLGVAVAQVARNRSATITTRARRSE